MVQAKQPFFPIGRKEGRNGGGVYVRGGGGTEERVLAERLEGEAAEESGGAVGVVPGAVVAVHGDEEDGDAGHGGGRDEPRRPAPVVGPRPDHLLLPVVVRGPGGGAGITSRQRGGALLLLVAVLVGEGGGRSTSTCTSSSSPAPAGFMGDGCVSTAAPAGDGGWMCLL